MPHGQKNPKNKNKKNQTQRIPQQREFWAQESKRREREACRRGLVRAPWAVSVVWARGGPTVAGGGAGEEGRELGLHGGGAASAFA